MDTYFSLVSLYLGWAQLGSVLSLLHVSLILRSNRFLDVFMADGKSKKLEQRLIVKEETVKASS